MRETVVEQWFEKDFTWCVWCSSFPNPHCSITLSDFVSEDCKRVLPLSQDKVKSKKEKAKVWRIRSFAGCHMITDWLGMGNWKMHNHFQLHCEWGVLVFKNLSLKLTCVNGLTMKNVCGKASVIFVLPKLVDDDSLLNWILKTNKLLQMKIWIHQQTSKVEMEISNSELKEIDFAHFHGNKLKHKNWETFLVLALFVALLICAIWWCCWNTSCKLQQRTGCPVPQWLVCKQQKRIQNENAKSDDECGRMKITTNWNSLCQNWKFHWDCQNVAFVTDVCEWDVWD